MADAVPTASTPRVTPTATMPVRIPWGDWLDQLIANEQHVIEHVAEAGVGLALSAVPVGKIVSMFITPKIIDQYVDMGLSAVQGVVRGQVLTIDSSNLIVSTVVNLIIKNEPKFADWVGKELDSLVIAGLAKVVVKI